MTAAKLTICEWGSSPLAMVNCAYRVVDREISRAIRVGLRRKEFRELAEKGATTAPGDRKLAWKATTVQRVWDSGPGHLAEPRSIATPFRLAYGQN